MQLLQDLASSVERYSCMVITTNILCMRGLISLTGGCFLASVFSSKDPGFVTCSERDNAKVKKPSFTY